MSLRFPIAAAAVALALSAGRPWPASNLSTVPAMPSAAMTSWPISTSRRAPVGEAQPAAVPGRSDITADWNGATWAFATEEKTASASSPIPSATLPPMTATVPMAWRWRARCPAIPICGGSSTGRSTSTSRGRSSASGRRISPVISTTPRSNWQDLEDDAASTNPVPGIRRRRARAGRLTRRRGVRSAPGPDRSRCPAPPGRRLPRRPGGPFRRGCGASRSRTGRCGPPAPWRRPWAAGSAARRRNGSARPSAPRASKR